MERDRSWCNQGFSVGRLPDACSGYLSGKNPCPTDRKVFCSEPRFAWARAGASPPEWNLLPAYNSMLPENPKLSSLNFLMDVRPRWRAAGQLLVMTNGCFDLLHPGHLYFLQNARQLGDRLLVALNSDESVRLLKGPGHPVQTGLERAYALAALGCVDHVVIFNEPNLMTEIAALQPDFYTKAGDYSLDKLHHGERAALEKCGAQIAFLPFLEGFSTTALIQKIAGIGGEDRR